MNCFNVVFSSIYYLLLLPRNPIWGHSGAHTEQFQYFILTFLKVFGLWEATGVPGGKLSLNLKGELLFF